MKEAPPSPLYQFHARLSVMERRLTEVQDRTKRIETRLTSYLIDQGAVVHVSKPLYDPDTRTLRVPAADCSIGDAMRLLAAVDTRSPIRVIVGEREWGSITLTQR